MENNEGVGHCISRWEQDHICDVWHAHTEPWNNLFNSFVHRTWVDFGIFDSHHFRDRRLYRHICVASPITIRVESFQSILLKNDNNSPELLTLVFISKIGQLAFNINVLVCECVWSSRIKSSLRSNESVVLFDKVEFHAQRKDDIDICVIPMNLAYDMQSRSEIIWWTRLPYHLKIERVIWRIYESLG
jgi:hypothetical protein